MIFNRKKLIQELEFVCSISFAKKNDILNHILFDCYKILRFDTTNLFSYIVSSVEPEKADKKIIPFTELVRVDIIDVLKKIKTDTIDLSFQDNYIVLNSGTNIKWSSKTLNASGFPSLEFGEFRRIAEVEARSLIESINKVDHARSNIVSRFTLSSIYVRFPLDTILALATDSNRLAASGDWLEYVENELDESSDIPGVLIPKESLKLIESLEGKVKIDESRNFIYFKCNDRLIAFRKYDNETKYPNIKLQDTLSDSSDNFQVLSVDLLEGIERLVQTNKGTAKFSLDKKKLNISTHQSNMLYSETIPCKKSTSEKIFHLNPSYLQDAIKSLDTDSLSISIKDKSIVIKPVKKDTEVRVIALMNP